MNNTTVVVVLFGDYQQTGKVKGEIETNRISLVVVGQGRFSTPDRISQKLTGLCERRENKELKKSFQRKYK